MKRQEVLLNVTVVVIIAALAYITVEGRQDPTTVDELDVRIVDVAETEFDEDETPEEETSYDATVAQATHPNFGRKEQNIFQPLLTRTPVPPTPTPTPTPTPDIGVVLSPWGVRGIYKGAVTIEDVNKTKIGAEDSYFEMKIGESRPVDTGPQGVKQATLLRVDEETDPYNPAAIFGLEGTTAEKTIRVLDETVPLALPGAQPGTRQGPATPAASQ